MKTKPKTNPKLTRKQIEEREDKIDLRDARRILNDPKTKWIPYEIVRKELGLD